MSHPSMKKVLFCLLLSIWLGVPSTWAQQTIKTIRQPALASEIIFLPQPDRTTWISYNQDPYIHIFSEENTAQPQTQVTVENETQTTQYLSVRPLFQRLWYAREGETLSKKLAPGMQNTFIFPVTHLPRRKWPGKVTISVVYTPSIDELPDDAVEKGFWVMNELSYTTNFFLIPRELVGILGAVLLLTILWPRRWTKSDVSPPRPVAKKPRSTPKRRSQQSPPDGI